jgi:hypothetical protein
MNPGDFSQGNLRVGLWDIIIHFEKIRFMYCDAKTVGHLVHHPSANPLGKFDTLST